MKQRNNQTGHRNMQCNAGALRQYRVKNGWSQEKLAIMSGLNTRTIQRAEAGEALSLETFSQVSSALNVPLAEILGDASGAQGESEDGNVAVLRRCSKGIEIVNLLTKAFNANVTIEVEPEPQWLEDTAALLDEISDLSPDPWRDKKTITLSDRLRRGAALTQTIQKIEEGGIGVFIGQYTALERVPRYDMDEGHYYVLSTQKPEFVQYAVISIASAAAEKMTVRVENKYVEPEIEKLDLDDEIPF
jgi:transcriptional regulator with XRE-family HTH domain